MFDDRPRTPVSGLRAVGWKPKADEVCFLNGLYLTLEPAGTMMSVRCPDGRRSAAINIEALPDSLGEGAAAIRGWARELRRARSCV